MSEAVNHARGRAGWRTVVILAAAIFAALLFENRHYLFATKLYENSDWAANSLLVREAKHSLLIHGHYSQYHFHHPGPALIDTLAAGEMLFHDALGIVPTPYNGQLLALCAVLTCAFSLALSICARQLGDGGGGHLFFLPLALIFAVLHYGAVGAQVFLDAWPAFPLIGIFLCFVVTSAAVAAGSGRSLPVLATAGGWLVHNHVAQPLFVVPLTLLAYAGLMTSLQPALGSYARRTGRWLDGITVGWRTFPVAHRLTVALLVLFILPLAVDATRGSESNAADILRYLRTTPKHGHGFWSSVFYFLSFAGYDTFPPAHRQFADRGAEGMYSYMAGHWIFYALWLTVLVATVVLFLTLRRRSAPDAASDEQAHSRRRFLRCLCFASAASCGLTLVWGMKQGPVMNFYDAYFNYSIYFCLALGLAAAGSMALMTWTASPPMRKARHFLSGTLWSALAVVVVVRASSFRASALDTPESAAAQAVVERAAASLPAGGFCYLDTGQGMSWRASVAVGLALERLGHPFLVNDNWAILFGRGHTIQRREISPAVPLTRWAIMPVAELPGRSEARPLLFGNGLEMDALPVVDPAVGPRIVFARGGNYHEFALCGWSDTDADWTWSDQPTALMTFRPASLAPDVAGVDVTISASSGLAPEKIGLQRVVVSWNGTLLDTMRLPLPDPAPAPLSIRIDHARWQEAATKGEARLQFVFPDARSPAELGLGADMRLLGGSFRGVEFRPVSTP